MSGQRSAGKLTPADDYEHLVGYWHLHGCPECGGSRVQRPTEPLLLERTLAAVVCGQCGRAFSWHIDQPRALDQSVNI